MHLELVRIVVDALKDDTYGVNAKLPQVPRDPGDEPAKPVAEIYDVTRHDHVVRRQEPPKLPCLYVLAEGPAITIGEALTGTYRDTTEPVSVVVRYLSGEQDLARAVQDGTYVLRAALRSIRALLDQSQDGVRTRNGICLTHLVRVGEVPVRETVGEAAVAGALTLEVQARDAQPVT